MPHTGNYSEFNPAYLPLAQAFVRSQPGGGLRTQVQNSAPPAAGTRPRRGTGVAGRPQGTGVNPGSGINMQEFANTPQGGAILQRLVAARGITNAPNVSTGQVQPQRVGFDALSGVRGLAGRGIRR